MTQNRRSFLQTVAGVGLAGAGLIAAPIRPAPAPVLAPDPQFIPMMEKIFGIQSMLADRSFVWQYSVRQFGQFDSTFRTPVSKVPSIKTYSHLADVGQAPTIDLWNAADRTKLMDMGVSYLMSNTKPLPQYVYPSNTQAGFKQAMNDIARITRRGMGNVLIANAEGMRRLNGSYEFWAKLSEPYAVRTIVLPLDREPFALLGYDGPNQYDTGAILALRIYPEEYESLPEYKQIINESLPEYRQIVNGQMLETYWATFSTTRMRKVRPVFVGNPNYQMIDERYQIGTRDYWRRLV